MRVAWIDKFFFLADVRSDGSSFSLKLFFSILSAVPMIVPFPSRSSSVRAEAFLSPLNLA